jgi:hypothetical protein
MRKLKKFITYYRVTEADTFIGSKPFSNVGDTIAITERPDTDSVYNLTTNMHYTYGGEQGTVIPDIDNFPLFDNEKANLANFRR